MSNETVEPRKALIEFPDYQAADLPALPEGFADQSWHNDSCPCFINEAVGLVVFVDYADPSMREESESARFSVSVFAGGEIGGAVLETESWATVLELIADWRAELAAGRQPKGAAQ